MKKWLVILLSLVLVFSISGCKNEDNTAASGEFLDPYEAYGLKKGEEGLGAAMYEKPPKAITFQPFLLHAFKPEGVALNLPEITMTKGDKQTITIDEVVVMSEDNIRKSTGYIQAKVEITFNPPAKGEGLMFEVNNEGSSKTIYQQLNLPDRVRNEKSFSGETQYQIAKIGVEGIPFEPYLIFILGQKGSPGNSGEILCRITGVKI